MAIGDAFAAAVGTSRDMKMKDLGVVDTQSTDLPGMQLEGLSSCLQEV